jgi:hypothetical protein
MTDREARARAKRSRSLRVDNQKGNDKGNAKEEADSQRE